VLDSPRVHAHSGCTPGGTSSTPNLSSASCPPASVPPTCRSQASNCFVLDVPSHRPEIRAWPARSSGVKSIARACRRPCRSSCGPIAADAQLEGDNPAASAEATTDQSRCRPQPEFQPQRVRRFQTPIPWGAEKGAGQMRALRSDPGGHPCSSLMIAQSGALSRCHAAGTPCERT